MAKQVKHQQSQCCYQNWVAQQRLDLEELLQALTKYPTDIDYLQLMTKKVITHFENYNEARAQLAKHDGPSFIAPTWGSTFENSFLWIGGSRPSLTIRLVYTLCGSQLNAHFAEFLEGVRHGNLGEISGAQLKGIDTLHAKTERVADEPLVLLANDSKGVGQSSKSHEEAVDKTMDTHALDMYDVLIEADKMRLNVLKGILYESIMRLRIRVLLGGPCVERVADEPLVLLANDSKGVGQSSKSYDEAVDKTMDTHALDMYDVLIEADKMRLNVLKGMIEILTPMQSVEFLVASKKLHLSLQEWSKRRDIRMGIMQLDIPSSSNDTPPKP
nr:putative transcription factor TGA like domain-containing protein [Tanacetum cinerariifolium]